MTKLDIIIPRPEIESDPEASALWDQTGNFIGTALARMERGRAFSIMLGRLQYELRQAYGAESARKVMQAIMPNHRHGECQWRSFRVGYMGGSVRRRGAGDA